jgi:PadR family transcriptional regulator PadR
MSARSKQTQEAVAETTSVDAARAAAGPAAKALGGGAGDPLLSEVRKAGLLPLLVLHFLAEGTSYGNQLMEHVSSLTAGAMAVNPNTMYPLLRSLESKGFILGEWEHPERRSRRFYRITRAGEAERERLLAEVEPRLAKMAAGIDLIRRELGHSI